ncbi:hypothetical protein DICSQDRAFT_170687 [Dichomitus squalens LYAD-421 SS1]|uniref:Uncharacterized protein n=1 Tax=Dichomitus squalens (strain LYAD-421) TaxID=732165 RepID=R7SXC6_DICSQ|nr:uncharacterized protein DICSQDRAFT_170687 [Dichomitus squalens LYAD-421 SS1]EJF60829.1 hypothetical protein DICSQDRAFT_170687 [Dichomitus squalens LYAD-421 SS1]
MNAGQSDGQVLLYNFFADNPKEPNFIAFALQRTTEPGGDDVAKISTFPASTCWTVLLEAMVLANNNAVVPLTTSVVCAPLSKAVVMLDSGTSHTDIRARDLSLDETDDIIAKCNALVVAKIARMDSNSVAYHLIVKRRITWIPGKLVAYAPVVHLTVDIALLECVDSVNFDANTFATLPPQVVTSLVRLTAEADSLEAKPRINDSLNTVIKRAESGLCMTSLYPSSSY